MQNCQAGRQQSHLNYCSLKDEFGDMWYLKRGSNVTQPTAGTMDVIVW